jgi:glutamate-5-semialdehyde dehydrogenase
VPVVQHYKGVCHLFLDEGVDLETATRIVLDAKLSRPGVCNALECLLVHEKEKERLLDPIVRALEQRGCEIRTGEEAYGVEFLDRVLSVRSVSGIDQAIEHVARYGSGHTEAILTKDAAHAERWRREVDAACVVVNASTRFHDGNQLGLGAEIGIATSRLHWRGPMGLEALTTMKWIVEGEGHVRG